MPDSISTDDPIDETDFGLLQSLIAKEFGKVKRYTSII